MMLNLEDYTYDDNGNLLTDANKGISLIKYNHLNLPTEIILLQPKKLITFTTQAETN